MGAEAYVVAALIGLRDGCDSAAVGAAVTTALCGHWEHEGPCRWPHNSAIDAERKPARFRTVYVADPDEADVVEQKIDAALRSTPGWQLVAIERRSVADPDRPLADRLLSGPRAPR